MSICFLDPFCRMSGNAGLIVILSDAVLNLYPILVKNVNVNMTTQLLSRLGIFSILGLGLSSPAERSTAFDVSPIQTILYSALNLVHIAVSYASYKFLPAGNALALFYTYPFWTVLAGWLFLGEKFDWRILALLVVAAVGTWLVATNSTIEGYEGGGKDQDHTTKTTYGVLLGLVSAFTETLIYLIAKTPTVPSPMFTILQLYPYAALSMLGYGLYNQNIDTHVSTGWLPLILFNVFIGFIGYVLRFFAIPQLSAGIFSVLSFIGVASAFFWQVLFTDETPNKKALLGSALITGSVAALYSA
jgi:drug/metabolite transporter (DMT)-like permease